MILHVAAFGSSRLEFSLARGPSRRQESWRRFRYRRWSVAWRSAPRRRLRVGRCWRIAAKQCSGKMWDECSSWYTTRRASGSRSRAPSPHQRRYDARIVHVSAEQAYLVVGPVHLDYFARSRVELDYSCPRSCTDKACRPSCWAMNCCAATCSPSPPGCRPDGRNPKDCRALTSKAMAPVLGESEGGVAEISCTLVDRAKW